MKCKYTLALVLARDAPPSFDETLFYTDWIGIEVRTRTRETRKACRQPRKMQFVPRQQEVPIGGVRVKFPFKPYPSQKAMMAKARIHTQSEPWSMT